MTLLSKLPTELMFNIISCLDSSDLFALAQTAKKWRDPALEAIYTHPKISRCAGLDFNYIRSCRRVVNLTITLLQSPSLARRVRSLDLDVTCNNNVKGGPGLYLMPRWHGDRSASQQQLYDLAIETIAGGFAYSEAWVRRIASGSFTTCPGFSRFVECSHECIDDYNIEFPLTNLPGLRSVKHVHLEGFAGLSWEWLSLPSLHSFKHAGLMQRGLHYHDDQISQIQVLRTNVPSIKMAQHKFFVGPPFENFQHLRAIHIGLITMDERTRRNGDIDLDAESAFGGLNHFFEELLLVASTLEILEMRPIEATKPEASDLRPKLTTHLQSFSHLKQLGVPAYFLAPLKVLSLYEEDDLFFLKDDDIILGIDEFPPRLEVLTIFQDGNATPSGQQVDGSPSYYDDLNYILRHVLESRGSVSVLNCIRVEFSKGRPGMSRFLRLKELQEVGIRVESVPAYGTSWDLYSDWALDYE